MINMYIDELSDGVVKEFNYDRLVKDTFNAFIEELNAFCKEKNIEFNRYKCYFHFENVKFLGIELEGSIIKYIMMDAYLSHCVLYGCIFNDTTFADTSFTHCDISNCVFGRNADFFGLHMSLCEIRHNSFNCKKIEGYLYSCELTGNDFNNVDLRELSINEQQYYQPIKCNTINTINKLYYTMACPSDGAFVGWKKAFYGDRLYIVKLLIPEDAKRSSAFSNKCRCSKAKVLEIQNLDGSKADIDFVYSNYDESFKYNVGEWVYPNSFDENRFEECSNGIHFFINREDAVRYHTI